MTSTGNRVTVAAAQVAGTADIDKNLAAIEALAAQAAGKGAELIVFPEAVMYEYSASAERLARMANEHGEHCESRLEAIALQHKIAIVAGTYSKGEGHLARNMMVAVGPDGAWLGRYQKLHLYDAFHYKESEKNEPAKLQPDFGELVTFDLAGFRFGLLNCYDIRFPEMSRALIDRGADVLLVSSGWVPGPLKEFHWETLLKARAIENTCFVAASCQPAPSSVGLSMILDPNGIPVSTVPAGEGLAITTIDTDRLAKVREVLPCLGHRRYAIAQRA
ncbi:hydrolase [Pseudaminobacter arsenicus]|uniref:Hydrolase n=1 Tax=Borborobacter arsenicus TaxID=1851146 RepID=A0A432V215_9HYPH|nr:nitrilase-related carbon-nitrogen hydrolase [Pseudaminobacter arsenicus]RUM96102.1 hydrolase [Pseudaminobacter arsenicus]